MWPESCGCEGLEEPGHHPGELPAFPRGWGWVIPLGVMGRGASWAGWRDALNPSEVPALGCDVSVQLCHWDTPAPESYPYPILSPSKLRGLVLPGPPP